MRAPTWLLVISLAGLVACERKSSEPSAAASANAEPAAGRMSVELGVDLSKLSGEGLDAWLTRAGWKTAAVASSRAGTLPSMVRVTAVKLAEKRLDATVSVRCSPKGSPPVEHPEGSAWVEKDACQLEAAVRVGIRPDLPESKRLIEALAKSVPQ